MLQRHKKRRSSRRAWHKCHFVCIRYSVFRSSRITIHLACGVVYLDNRIRFVSRADEILLSIHRLDDESNMLMSWQLRSSREREFHLFQSVVIVKLRLHFTNCVPDMWHKESVSEHSDRSTRNAFWVMLAMSDEAST